ncbi:hypothetical protein WA026_000063 [Henosepilachna vigintioctopunctata]|uniref:Uncharacterized protein n=1 Tax=Henosepilachna vigintioctopunctata TaxID=420089 RepID=A0AAW1UX92_9CUCU
MNHLQILNDATHRAHASGYVEEDHSDWKPSNNHGHGQTYGPPQAAAAWPSTPINVAYKVNHEETPKWHGPEHHPVLDHNGVPVDTHEVQHARKAHLAVLAAESAKHAGWEGAQKKW